MTTTNALSQSTTYAYDANSRQTAMTNETITLDPRAVNGSVAYGLDPVGNLSVATIESVPVPGVFGHVK